MNQGMGDKLRDQVFHVDEGMMMDRLVHESDHSEDTKKIIDQEVEALITEAGNRARVVIEANKKSIERLKDILIEKETVDDKEVLEAFRDSVLPKEAKLY